LNGIQEVDGSIPFSSTTLDRYLASTYTDPALRKDGDETPKIEGRRSCFAPGKRRGDRVEDALLARPVATSAFTTCGIRPLPRCFAAVAMTRDELLSRITIDPNMCFGKPCIRGHRIWVSLILDLLADGMSTEEILSDYPGLDEADVRACIAYGHSG
jgi:uncharacterized protein (DUF433 family)